MAGEGVRACPCPHVPALVAVCPPSPPCPEPPARGAPPELAAADARLSLGSTSPSPGTHKRGEGSFPGPFLQPCSPADTNIRLLFRSYCSFFFFFPSCTNRKSGCSPQGPSNAADPTHEDHLAELLLSLSPHSSFTKGCREGRGMCGCPPRSLLCFQLFPGAAGRNLPAPTFSPAPLLFSAPAFFPGEDGD